MGKHYVPQKHLSRFGIKNRPNAVWMYDKKTRKWSDAAISKVAQQADFYSQDVEKALANEVETPGNNCVDKLLRRESFSDRERVQLSLYMMIMATRGPGPRKKATEIAARTAKEIIDEARTQVEDWIATDNNLGSDFPRTRLNELDELEKKWQQVLPDNVLSQIRQPFWSIETLECILSMAWHIVPSTSDTYYVTSDKPAHFFEGLGLCNTQSEFTFALSATHALIGEHKSSGQVLFEKPQSQLVKEVNRTHAEWN